MPRALRSSLSYSDLLLHQHLEVRGHPARQDHLARAEPEACDLGLAGGERALALELFEQARAKQERVQAFERDGPQARALARPDDLRPVDRRRQVLLARALQHVFNELLAAEGAQRAPAPVRRAE